MSDEEDVVNVDDDALIRRFLVGDVTSEERAAVEARLIADAGYDEQLRAAEEALIFLYVQKKLPPEWQARVKAAIVDVPSRRRHVDRMQRFVTALDMVSLPRPVPQAAPPPVTTSKPSESSKNKFWWLALAAVVAAAIAAAPAIMRWAGSGAQRGTQPGVTPGPGSSASTPSTGIPGGAAVDPETGFPVGTVLAVVLQPGLSRLEAPPANVIRVPAGTQAIRLRFSEMIGPLAAMRATIQPVGAPPIEVGREAVIRSTEKSIEVDWVIPVTFVPRGDYIVRVSGETRARERESLASRFFSIVEERPAPGR